MKFRQIGLAKAGAPTVIVSAGLGGLGRFWQPQFEALGRAFRIVAYDHRGTGENAANLEGPYSIENMADDVEQIVEASGTASYHFVGHALGGLVGLALARRPRSRCASLCLVNAWASLDTQTSRCFEMRMALLKHVGVEAYVNAQPIFLYPAAWLSDHAAAIEDEVRHGIEGFQGTSNLLARIGALRAFDAAPDLANIRVPTLVAASQDDILVPFTRSQALAAGLPAAKLWMTAHGGHAFTVTAPEPFNAILVDFVREAAGG
ncbi:MAG: pyrimidine utilization protein D [Bradyrhizobium sp.]|nr:pyrimidine utilization protein D [Bradyrhizobium sp.]